MRQGQFLRIPFEAAEFYLLRAKPNGQLHRAEVFVKGGTFRMIGVSGHNVVLPCVLQAVTLTDHHPFQGGSAKLGFIR